MVMQMHSARRENVVQLCFSRMENAINVIMAALSSMEFYALGMENIDEAGGGVYLTNFAPIDNVGLGRGNFTENPTDNYKFKVPQLYNLIQSRFYGHGSTFRSIEAILHYKNEAQPENPDVPQSHLAEEFHPLNLTSQEIEDLAAFIEYGLTIEI